jgi:hypothetical protein
MEIPQENGTKNRKKMALAFVPTSLKALELTNPAPCQHGQSRKLRKKCRPDWDITKPELKAAWERGEHDRFYPYGKTYGQLFREQE